MTVSHWDDVERLVRDAGDIRASFRRKIGRAHV